MDMFLHLENGKIFKGKSFGKVKITVGELVFSTAMIGHEEIISDPTNIGKILVMSYPIIGSYGFNFEDMQSNNPKTSAVICRTVSKYPSNFRCEMDVDSYFKFYKIVGVENIDTRELVKIISKEGSMKAVISEKLLTETQVQEYFKEDTQKNLIYKVTCKENYHIEGNKESISIIDLGIKKSLLNYFKSKNFNINVYSADFDYQEILNSNTKAIILSNGPGNPYEYKKIINNIQKLIGFKPILSFGVGTDLLTLALGGELKSLPFGHRTLGAPVKDLKSGKVYMTTQNHRNYIYKLPKNAKETFLNIEDQTIEGYSIDKENITAIHFQPEGAPGPDETLYVLENFLNSVGEVAKNA
ncbi:carbamoyl phosphate synthase small subunit [Miniphocaeibacter massiliensis]|uniref:carbamoyl phosphate synthase small subunit n=1 Tax=Miniphocaeibacter massiliensis TaxID=2041841 RepID=UPI000C1BECB3|nr:carbamoyl phosphate synthase small subunit [Miniphocaeibacter massiliensis]